MIFIFSSSRVTDTKRLLCGFCFFIISILLQGCENTPREKAYAKSVTINNCWFESKKDWPTTECGVLNVPEDYSKPEGNKISLPFIIVKPAVPDYKKYPLVVAGGGGPGGALGITEENADTFGENMWVSWYASTIEAGRDLILIDNRGVGSSVPRLNCFEVANANMGTLDKQLDREEVVKLIEESYGACRLRLVGQGIDISQYHVINAAKDLEELRIGLGVNQINLYGASYGTRVSLVFERLYPDSVRSLILDGIYPQSVSSYEEMPRQNADAMIRVINKCQADSQCFSQFGHNLKERLTDYLKHLEANPISISVTNPIDYSPIDVVVTPDVFFDSLFTMIYDGALIAYMPKYMYSAFRGNTDYLTELVRNYYVNDIVMNPLDVGAYASYTCFDELPFANLTIARNELKKYPFQHYSNKYSNEIAKAMCDVWAVPAAAAEFKDIYKIDTPVLIYSGELDPVTPAELAKPVIDNARISWEMVWPNIAHGVIFVSDCADWTAAEFLEDPESDPFIYECSDEVEKFRFEIR